MDGWMDKWTNGQIRYVISNPATQLGEVSEEGVASHLPSNTVKVRFSWTPLSGMSFKNVTLLSAFNVSYLHMYSQ